jgi:thioredoxin reductase (NADPH)
LYAAFQLGLLGLDAHIVDALPTIGGQCEALYADKGIYDIPGMVRTTGAQLAEQLLAQLAQIRAFAPLPQRLHLGQLVERLERLPEQNRYRIRSSAGQDFIAPCIILTAGVGAFVPRPLSLKGLDAVAPSLHHRPGQLADFAGQAVVIVGEEDEAVNWACDLAESSLPASVTLNHRRAQLAASPATQTRLQQLLATGALRFQAGLIQGFTHSGSALQSLQLLLADASTSQLPCSRLGVLLGLSPQMGPLADWGLALQRRQLPVDSATMATNLPGVFAAGDVIAYPGKLKLIACAFHEATLAAHAALAYCAPERDTPLQYTSSSALLQSRLQQL